MVKIRTSQAGNSGFTLLELLLVLFIVGLVSAVVSFSIGRLHEKALFNQEVRKVFQTVKHAREIALMKRRDISFRVESETGSYWLEGGQERRNLPGGVKITGEEIIFFPKGNSSGGSIRIEDEKGHGYEIEVDPVLGTPKLNRL